MFDIGWAEMGFVALIALLVLGPRELPRALHTIGRWVGRARAVVRDLQRGIEDIAHEAELDDLKKSVEDMSTRDYFGDAENMIDPSGDLREGIDAITDNSITNDTIAESDDDMTADALQSGSKKSPHNGGADDVETDAAELNISENETRALARES